jgi:hypothetical protein
MKHLAIFVSLTEGFDFFFGRVFCSDGAAGAGAAGAAAGIVLLLPVLVLLA